MLTGGANSGKTGIVLAEAIQAAEAGHAPAIILPTHPDAERIREELSHRFPLGIEVSRFDGIVTDLWPARGDGRTEVRSEQRRWLLSKCATSLGAPPGMPLVAERVLERLAGAAGERWREAALAVSRKEGDLLSKVLARYAQELEERALLEPGEAVHLLADSDTFPYDPVFFHRFTDLTPAQEHLVTTLSRAGRTVVVTLTWEEGRRATEGATDLVMRLSEVADSHERLPSASYTPVEEIARMQRGIFEEPEPAPPSGAVVFSTADTAETEVERVCAEIQRLRERHGLSGEEIAVVLPAPARRGPDIEQALQKAGIPSDLDVALPIARTPLGRAAVSLARFIATGLRDDLLRFMRSGYAWPESDVTMQLEVTWRRKGTEDAREVFKDLPRGRLKNSLRVLLSEKTTLPEAAKAWATTLDGMLRTRREEEGIAAVPEPDAAAHRAILRFLQDVVDLGEREYDPGLLSVALSRLKAAPARVERKGHVQIMGVDRIRGRRFRAVIIIGLNAGDIPRLREDFLSSPAATRLFREVGVEAPSGVTPAKERLSFYLAVTRAREHLVLSRASSGTTGREKVPSVFWEEARDLYRDLAVAEEDPPIEGLDKHACMTEVGLAEHLGITPRRLIRQAASEIGEGRASGTTLPARLHAARRRSSHLPEKMATASVLEEVSERLEFSASELEEYLQCPYKWLLNRHLRPDPVDLTLDAALRGRLAHRALAMAYEILHTERGVQRLTPADEGLAEEVALSAIERAVEEASLPEKGRESATAWLKPRIRRSLAADRWMPEGFIPTHMEIVLDQDGTGSVDMGDFRLRGRVDRVDVHPDGRAVIIDYKSSNTDQHTKAKIEKQGWLQVPLYAEALSRSMGLDVVAGLYRGLSDGRDRGFFAGDRYPGERLIRTDETEDVRLLTGAALSRACEAVAGIREGIVAPAEGDDRCEYCLAFGYCKGIAS